MACPFSRAHTTEIVPSDDERDVSKSTRISEDRSKPSRQSSVQIACSLLGEDNDDIEDTQTLNLKHLRAAVLVLTNPSRSVSNRTTSSEFSRLRTRQLLRA
ncbi:head-specific guanylate cyclase [Vespula maculifrons]|uniref:Head-specific guanylate cyclase n=1 Tax=Vespula maculifrons TaxID=7453 RepID=A0ABD2CP85_VESMC